MKINRGIFRVSALSAALFSAGLHAQSNEELKQALAQAQAAAAQAQAAARQAHETLMLVQAAMAKQAAAPTSNVTLDPKAPGFTFQSGPNSLTLYGLIDITASRRNNANAAGQTLTGLQTAWFSGNRFGITGKRDLGGDGLKAIFRLESEFDYRTGAEDTAGVFFNRDAWLGLESDTMGKLTVGRQNALGRDIAAGYLDPYGAAKASTAEGGGTNTNNFKQLIFYAGSATGTRYDRGVVWKKAFNNGLVAGVGYQFGNAVGAFNNNTTKSLALAYNGGPFNVAGFIQTATVSNLKHNSWSIGGNYTFGIVRLNAGYFNYSAQQNGFATRTDNAYTLSAKIAPQGKFDYEVGYQSMRAKNAGLTGAGATANVLVAYADTSAGILSTVTGNRNTLYGSIFYHFDEQAEVYLVADRLMMSGGYRQGSVNGKTSQNEYGMGMRYKF